MKYNRKDIDNNNLKIVIAVGNRSYNTDRVYCTLYRVDTYNLILFKYNILREIDRNVKSIYEVEDWTCEQYEKWADECLLTYNKVLLQREKNIATKDKITNGCK